VTIQIFREDGRYTAVTSPPHGSRSWRTPEPLSAQELVIRLRELGCHTTDIGDAFCAAYPGWLDDIGDEASYPVPREQPG